MRALLGGVSPEESMSVTGCSGPVCTAVAFQHCVSWVAPFRAPQPVLMSVQALRWGGCVEDHRMACLAVGEGVGPLLAGLCTYLFMSAKAEGSGCGCARTYSAGRCLSEALYFRLSLSCEHTA